MHRRTALKLLTSSTIGGIATLSGCTRLNSSNSSPVTNTPEATNTVQMVTRNQESFFDPIGLFVEPGETITFVMKSGNHSATAYHERYSLAEKTQIPKNAKPFDSGVITKEGKTFTHTFQSKGTYDYYCTPHKPLGMVARIVVGEPGGPAEGSMPPDGSVPTSRHILKQGAVKYSEFDP